MVRASISRENRVRRTGGSGGGATHNQIPSEAFGWFVSTHLVWETRTPYAHKPKCTNADSSKRLARVHCASIYARSVSALSVLCATMWYALHLCTASTMWLYSHLFGTNERADSSRVQSRGEMLLPRSNRLLLLGYNKQFTCTWTRPCVYCNACSQSASHSITNTNIVWDARAWDWLRHRLNACHLIHYIVYTHLVAV